MIIQLILLSEITIVSVTSFIVSFCFAIILTKFCSQVEVSDYNPVQHEKGFHKKLNMLVKESLQFGYTYSLPCSMLA